MMTYHRSNITRAFPFAGSDADRLLSAARSMARPAFTVLLLVMLSSMLFTGIAAANHGGGHDTGWLCDDNDDSQFVITIQNLLLILMVAGPVIGTVMAAIGTVAASAKHGDSKKDYIKMRKNALIYGWSVPVLIYLLEVLASILFGFDISCIIP